MIKKPYLLLLFVLPACLAACTRGKTVKPMVTPSAIVGTWLLQKQDVTVYADGVKQSDTAYTASDTSYSDLQFKGDGTFSGLSRSIFKNGTALAADTVNGTYAYTSQSFSVNGQLPGFIAAGGYLNIGPGAPVRTLLSNSAAVIQVTSIKLIIHTELSYTSSLNNVSTNYKVATDYYYNKFVPLM